MGLFQNPNLGPASNSMLWWTWESIFHHLYFIVLWIQRQQSEHWGHEGQDLWKLNLEKECAFFKQLFGGDDKLCAEGMMKLFTGLWFRTDKPVDSQLAWIGRLVTNYQQSEAVAHFLIFFLGLMIVAIMLRQKEDLGSSAVPAVLRWVFFVTLLFEVTTMCIPYSVLFTWAFIPFMNDDGVSSPLTLTVMEDVRGDHFLSGVQFGAALITMAWVSHVVLILDGTAMIKAWNFALSGKQTVMINVLFWGLAAAVVGHFMVDFFSPHGRGFLADKTETFSTRLLEGLHTLYGQAHIPMYTIANASTTCLEFP